MRYTDIIHTNSGGKKALLQTLVRQFSRLVQRNSSDVNFERVEITFISSLSFYCHHLQMKEFKIMLSSLND